MKKIFLLLLSMSLLFVIGCGSGGGGSTADIPTSSPDGSSNVGNAASFTLTLNDGGTPAVAASSGLRHTLAIAAGTADHVRAVIRKMEDVHTSVPTWTEYDNEGNGIGTPVFVDVVTYKETYRRVVDAAISGNTAQITAPVSADSTDTYTFDVLTYRAGTPNEMLKSGHAEGVVVADNGNLSMTVYDICADPDKDLADATKVGSVFVQIPSRIISEQAYKVTADARTPIKKYFELGVSLASSGTTPSNTYDLATKPVVTSGTASLIAPFTQNQSDTSLLFAVKFFISDDMLDKTKNESFRNWVRVYPNDFGITGETLQSTFTPLASVQVPAQ